MLKGMTVGCASLAFTLVFCSAPRAMDSGFILRCGNGTVRAGDSELSLVKTCGEPTLKKTESVPYRVGKRVHQKDYEKWYYNRGRNDFIYIITIDAGKIQRIETGERGH